MGFQAQFEVAICVDTIEHVFPGDLPGVVVRFQ